MSAPARRLRVALMIDTLYFVGGAERLVEQIAVRLDRDRFDPTVIVTRPLLGQHAEEIRAHGVPLYVLNRRGRGSVWRWLQLLAYLRRSRFDVLHAHMVGSNVWAAILGPLAGVPVVLGHEHTWSYEGQPFRRFLDREIVARRSTLLLAVSRADRSRMTSVEGIDPAKTRFVALGIPKPAPLRDRDVRAELGIPGDAPVVGTACGLRPQKALEVLVDAAAELAPRLRGLQVLIAGDGEDRERLARYIESGDLGDTVRLVGAWDADEIPTFLASVDVAVNCSDFEGSPLAVMEFMAAGKPIVATRVGGTPDLIQDEVHGLLVERRDARALAAAIERVLGDRELADRLGRAARERQREEFDIDAFVRRIEELYVELFAARAS